MARRGNRSLITVLLFLALAGLAAFMSGLVEIDTSGKLKAPDVAVAIDKGELPAVQVETARVAVGTREETIKVPDVDVDVGAREVAVELPKISIDRADDDGGESRP